MGPFRERYVGGNAFETVKSKNIHQCHFTSKKKFSNEIGYI